MSRAIPLPPSGPLVVCYRVTFTLLEGVRVSVTPRPLPIPGKVPVLIVQEAGWAPGPVWTGAENFVPPGFDPRTVRPAASLYSEGATRSTRASFCVMQSLLRS
jgi:hypothetical protein